MGIRETMNQKPIIGKAIAGGLCAVALVLLVYSMSGSSTPRSNDEAFFSSDDGKTWFSDDVKKLPPFDKDGQQAVRAYVYRSSDGKEFVSYLERFKPDAKRAIEGANKVDPKKKVAVDQSAIQNAFRAGREVKRPGEAKWIGSDNLRDSMPIITAKADTVPVEP